MKIVVTGAQGFIGRNLCFHLSEIGFTDVIKIDKQSSASELNQALAEAQFVFHLAGVNRPQHESEFARGNADFTQQVLTQLQAAGNKAAVMLSSSTQASRDNAYGQSKANAESLLEAYAANSGAAHYIYRFPNVFGKWCRPNYNSFVATFCHNITQGLEISIHDPQAPVTLVYIDDVCKQLVSLLQGQCESGYQQVTPEYSTTVGEVAEQLRQFKASRETMISEAVGTGLTRALYSTFLSYYTPEQFSYTVPSYQDPRGRFCEMLKTKDAGQFSFFTAHPGITRGGHYHHSKNEKFLVIKGTARYKFEQIATGERFELTVDASEHRIVETVPGWSHDITNIGQGELIVMLWGNEIFDRDAPDTVAKPL